MTYTNFIPIAPTNRDHDILEFDAVLQPNGSYIDGDGTITWYNDKGDSHREDGPAIIYSAPYLIALLNGSAFWSWHGNEYTFKDWLKLTTITDEQKLLLRLQYG